jgi:hypothetical protein
MTACDRAAGGLRRVDTVRTGPAGTRPVSGRRRDLDEMTPGGFEPPLSDRKSDVLDRARRWGRHALNTLRPFDRLSILVLLALGCSSRQPASASFFDCKPLHDSETCSDRPAAIRPGFGLEPADTRGAVNSSLFTDARETTVKQVFSGDFGNVRKMSKQFG